MQTSVFVINGQYKLHKTFSCPIISLIRAGLELPSLMNKSNRGSASGDSSLENKAAPLPLRVITETLMITYDAVDK